MKTEAPDSKPEIRGFVFMGSGLGIVQGSAFAPAQPKNAARRASPRSWTRARSELQQRPILWNLDALLDAFFLDIGSQLLAALAHVVDGIHVGRYHGCFRQRLGGAQHVFLAHDDGAVIASHLRITRIQHYDFRLVPGQRLVDLVAPDGVACEVERLVSGRLEDDADRNAEKLCEFRSGEHRVGTVLAAGSAQSDAAELRLVLEDSDVAKALPTDELGIGLVLYEQREILGQHLLGSVIPVIQVRMRDDYRIDPGEYLFGRHRQLDQRVAKLAAIGALEPGIGAFPGEHRVDQEGRVGKSEERREG